MLRTDGTLHFDRFKLACPSSDLFSGRRPLAVFTNLGNPPGNGVPILQALTIVKETAGNVLIANVVAKVHENVKQGEPIAPTLKCSGSFQ